MHGWNFGDLFDALAPQLGDRPALIHHASAVTHAAGEGAARTLVRTWADLERLANNLARALRAAGCSDGDKVAFYMRNSPAYLELAVACFKARLVHVNVNYRYVDEELAYVLDNADAVAVVFDAEFRPQVARLRTRLPQLRVFVEAGAEASSAADEPSFARDFDAVAESGDGSQLGLARSGDDLLFIYTGGTTGMPKGVMWRQEDRIGVFRMNQGDTPAAHAAAVLARPAGPRMLPACPLMHSTGFTSSLGTLVAGGCVVTMAEPRFDARACLETIAVHRVTAIAIVGDAFANPVLAELDAAPGAWDLSSLERITSAGVMWSEAAKQGLLRHKPDLLLIDSLGSSEGSGLASSITRAGEAVPTARFRIGDGVKVFTEDLREVQPGSGESGMIAKSGHIPLGYYKDEARTARTFPVVDGVRYVLPGDWCTVEADGSIVLLGRGSNCINTGGEKVFPEEVEEALKRHPDVLDALVVGVPDARWGSAVTGVVQLRDGRGNAGRPSDAAIDEAQVRQFLRAHLADYKIPKRVLVMPDLGRAANGKADYRGVREFVLRMLGA